MKWTKSKKWEANIEHKNGNYYQIIIEREYLHNGVVYYPKDYYNLHIRESVYEHSSFLTRIFSDNDTKLTKSEIIYNSKCAGERFTLKEAKRKAIKYIEQYLYDKKLAKLETDMARIGKELEARNLKSKNK